MRGRWVGGWVVCSVYLSLSLLSIVHPPTHLPTHSIFSGKGAKKKSVSELLVSEGLATVMRHRDEEVSGWVGGWVGG